MLEVGKKYLSGRYVVTCLGFFKTSKGKDFANFEYSDGSANALSCEEKFTPYIQEPKVGEFWSKPNDIPNFGKRQVVAVFESKGKRYVVTELEKDVAPYMWTMEDFLKQGFSKEK